MCNVKILNTYLNCVTKRQIPKKRLFDVIKLETHQKVSDANSYAVEQRLKDFGAISNQTINKLLYMSRLMNIYIVVVVVGCCLARLMPLKRSSCNAFLPINQTRLLNYV